MATKQKFPIDEQQIKDYWKMINHTEQPHVFQCFKSDGKASSTKLIKKECDLSDICKEYNLMGLSCLSINSVASAKIKTETISEVNNILIDVDVKDDRKKNGVSTTEDKEKTKETAYSIKKELDENINLRVSMLVDSGNGFHIYIPIKTKNEPGVKKKLTVLEEQLKRFNNDICHIDCISKDIARRVKIPGTWNVKEGISEENYRLCTIIEKEKDAITKAVVDGNTEVFNAIELNTTPTDEPEDDVEKIMKEKGVDREVAWSLLQDRKEREIIQQKHNEIKINLDEFLKNNRKARDLFEGHWKKYGYNKDKTKKKKWSKSEAEMSLCTILFNAGLSDSDVQKIMDQSKIGKWSTSGEKYQKITIQESKKYANKIKKEKQDKKELLTPPNQPNLPNPTNTTNPPNPPDNSYLLSLFSKEKRPFQSIGRGLHNGVCYVGTYLEDGESGHTYDAVVTSDRRVFIDTARKTGNEWTGKNQIKLDFGLKYRDPFYADVLDFTWGNSSIKSFFMNGYKIDISELFDRIVKINQKFMRYEEEFIHKFIAVDIMRSFFHFLFTANSRVYFHADKGSGKTNQLMIYRALSFNPVSSPDFSSSSIYRVIESTGGTILIDDFDQLPDEQKNAIIQHIRANYKPFKVLRSDSSGHGFRPRGFNAYSHLAFNNVLGLNYDDVTLERCIIIRLLKHKDALDITVNHKDPSFTSIRDDLYVCLMQYWNQVKETYDSLKVEGLSSRELELFKPLLAIAKVIGGTLYDDLLKFATEYFKQENMKELSDDWEFCLLKSLWFKVKDFEDDKKIITVTVSDLAEEIKSDLKIDFSTEDGKKRFHSLRIFIGNKLTSYLFKKKNPQNRVEYDVFKSRVEQISDVKGWLGLLGRLSQKEGMVVVKDDAGNYVISEDFEDIHNKISNLMSEKLLYDWSINEICHELGYTDTENRKRLQYFLDALTSDPHNPSDIGKSSSDGYFHLINSVVRGDSE